MPGWDPVELEDPEWLDGGKAREDPGSRTRKSEDFESSKEKTDSDESHLMKFSNLDQARVVSVDPRWP